MRTVKAFGLRKTMMKSEAVLTMFGNATIQRVGKLEIKEEMRERATQLISSSLRKAQRC